MSNSHRTSVGRRVSMAVAAAGAAALVLAGCSNDDSSASDNASSAVDSASSVASSAADAAGSAAASATSAAQSATSAAGESAESGSPETVEAADGSDVTLSGAIADKYREFGGDATDLGKPTGAQTDVAGGAMAEFDGGIIAWSPDTGAHVVWGMIRDTWEQNGGAEGELGFPTSDEQDKDGGKESTFQHGTITFRDGQTEVMKN